MMRGVCACVYGANEERRRSDVQLAKRPWNVLTTQSLGILQVQNPMQLLYSYWMQEGMNKENLI